MDRRALTQDKEPRMLAVSARTLKVLAAAVWLVGGLVLVAKGTSLLIEAAALRPQLGWPWLGTVAGLLLGWLKARYVFSHSCRKNLARIDALEQPRLWQFYSARFFLMLSLMITAALQIREDEPRYA